MFTQEALDALIAAIDGDVAGLDKLPISQRLTDGVAGQIMLAARAAKRVREEAADVIGCACTGAINSALSLLDDTERDLATMRKRLETARDLTAGG